MISGDDLEAKDEAELIPNSYIAVLSGHIRETLEHYRGRDRGDPLPPSFFPPSSYWTSEEKDAFFHGLVIHSRLRPDLIAAEIKTKSVVDVCIYLDMLEEAASRSSRGTGTSDHVNADASRFVVLPRREFPAALEVSDEWIAVEEEKALAVIRAESGILEKELREGREEEIRLSRNRIRARKGEARTTSNERDREGEKQRKKEFDEWLRERKAQWEVEDLLGTLDGAGLQALDRILREDEKSRHSESCSDVQQTGSQGSQARSSRCDSSASAKTKAPVEQCNAEIARTVVDGNEAMIDPVLLEMSGISQTQPPPAVDDCSVHVPGQFHPRTPPFETKSLSDRVDHSVLDPIHTSEARNSVTIDEGVKTLTETDDVASLSPGSRRRHQKKLYMRRKRAQGTDAPINETTERLRPGRKGKSKALGLSRQVERDGDHSQKSGPSGQEQQAVLRPSPDAQFSHVDSPDSVVHKEEQSSTRGVSQQGDSKTSGKTRTYKIGGQLADVGIDADWLYEEGLALFRMSGIVKLMRLNETLHDVPDSVCSQISVETIDLLHVLVVKFITQVVCRAIVLEEQERVAKARTKVWRRSENDFISSENVRRALALLGHEDSSKEAFFEALIRRYEDSFDSDEEGEDETSNTSSGESEDEDEAESSSSERADEIHEESDEDAVEAEREGGDHEGLCHDTMISTHRTIFAPFVRLPPTMSGSSHRAFNGSEEQLYLPWPAPSYEDPDPVCEEELMANETDEDAVAAELQDEEIIEAGDRLLDDLEEKSLWIKVREKGDVWSGSRNRKRKRKGDDGKASENGGDAEATAKRPRKQ